MLVDRHESELGRWEMAWSDPDPRLRAFVRRYAGYLEITPQPLRRRELPSGDVHFIISFGPPWDLPDPVEPDVRSDRHASFVAGLDEMVSDRACASISVTWRGRPRKKRKP